MVKHKFIRNGFIWETKMISWTAINACTCNSGKGKQIQCFSSSVHQECAILCNHIGMQTPHSAINAEYSVEEKHGFKTTADLLLVVKRLSHTIMHKKTQLRSYSGAQHKPPTLCDHWVTPPSGLWLWSRTRTWRLTGPITTPPSPAEAV